MPDLGNIGSATRKQLAQRRIWTTNATGEGAPIRLTNDPAYRDEQPMWSADGSHFLSARFDSGGKASLWLMHADGSNARQVVDEIAGGDIQPGAPHEAWWGYYGLTPWRTLFDWWQVTQPYVSVPAAAAGTQVTPPSTAASARLDRLLIYFQDGRL